MWSHILLLAPLVLQISATTYNVNVGRTGPNFEPNILQNVAVGDTVNFHFWPSNDSVAESSFSKPCKPKTGDDNFKPVFSGFLSGDDGVASTMFSMPINSTDPIWLYSSQGQHQHCRMGESMVINPSNNTDETLDKYMEAALKANVSSPQDIFGGVLIDDDGGQPDDKSRALPTTTLHATATSTAMATETAIVVKPTSGAPALAGNVLKELGVWLFISVVFVVTL